MDLRGFIALCEKEGQLKRIKAEVDWNLEISHVAKLVEEKSGPALLFENIKGYKSPVLTGAFGTTQRLAMILGKSPRLSMVELTKEWVNIAVKEVIKARRSAMVPSSRTSSRETRSIPSPFRHPSFMNSMEVATSAPPYSW